MAANITRMRRAWSGRRHTLRDAGHIGGGHVYKGTAGSLASGFRAVTPFRFLAVVERTTSLWAS